VYSAARTKKFLIDFAQIPRVVLEASARFQLFIFPVALPLLAVVIYVSTKHRHSQGDHAEEKSKTTKIITDNNTPDETIMNKISFE